MNGVRVRQINSAPLRQEGAFVLYWMTAFRRSRWNHSLDRAIEHARRMRKPLLVLEALRVAYPWASERLHRFVIDGMADNRKAFEDSNVRYYPYLERSAGQASGLLEALAGNATVVVTDDFPCFFLPRMVAAAGRKLEALGVRLEAIDGNGLYPIHDTDRVFSRAFDFRRQLQKRLPEFFDDLPAAEPLRKLDLPRCAIPRKILERWPRASRALLDGASGLEEFPIDHTVRPSGQPGGERAGAARLRAFLDSRLGRYGDERNHPDDDAASGLSPYLHFGHVSAHEIFWRLARREDWSPDQVARKASGARCGFWGMSPSAESFLDQLVTWREVGYNMTSHRPDHARYESLPDWAQRTLAEHAGDERPQRYTLEELERSETHDPIWNAAQRQLVREGTMQNYLRMLWGKKVLEWTASPQEALANLIELNNRFALDGRDPNSYSGIFWVFGRYDRAWGPERPIFGKIRYMSSENTKRKLRLGDYLRTYDAKAAASHDRVRVR